jgi:hypothetical protein
LGGSPRWLEPCGECTFWRAPYGSSAVLKSPRDCTMLGSSIRRVGLIDITVGQRDAPRRIATFRHATLRVAPHRYATLEPLGKPGGSRAFSAESSIWKGLTT